MTLGKTFWLACAVTFCAALANAGGITYTCDSSVDATAAGTCGYLNTTIAGLYGSTFSNATADIYIEQGITGLGGSATPESFVSFGDYLSALTSTASGSALDTSALAALNNLDNAVYGSGSVVITSALAGALGFTGAGGITSTGGGCTIGVDSGCYDGIIVVTTPANLASEPGHSSLYYRQLGGSLSNAYDYYSVVEHETDEILGTVSCMNTQGTTLTDPCDPGIGVQDGTGTPSANDLFRYYAAGSLALNNAYIGLASAPSGAYFSFNGGVTNGADGAVFNTISNKDDYADFAASCIWIQDARGCTGHSFDITTDGGAEINMLDAVGYNLVPEPGTMMLFGAGLLGIVTFRRFRRA